jgi:hypothetical protein
MKYILWGVATLALIAGISTVVLMAATYSEEICTARTDRNLMEGGATCSKRETVLIVKGTEDYTMSYDRKCAKYFAKPAFDRVGGIVGSNYIGCAIFR